MGGAEALSLLHSLCALAMGQVDYLTHKEIEKIVSAASSSSKQFFMTCSRYRKLLPLRIFEVQASNRDAGCSSTAARKGSQSSRKKGKCGGAVCARCAFSNSTCSYFDNLGHCACSLVQDGFGTKLYVDKEDEQILRDAVIKKGQCF